MTEQQARLFDIQKFLPYRTNILAKRMTVALSELYMLEFDITIPEWRTLLWTNSNHKVYAKDISFHCLMDKAQVSRVIANLEKRGLLTRQIDTEDHRSQILQLTQNGKALIEKIVPIATEWENKMKEVLSDEQYQALFSIIEQLDTQIEHLRQNHKHSTDK